jgi:metallo-beta-lactamase family protein
MINKLLKGIAIVVIILWHLSLSFIDTAKAQDSYPYIQFCGAAQMVDGSCMLLDTGKSRILIDFGLFYGSEHREINNELPFDPASISHVILTHAHLDHSGRIPMLYNKGFKGNVFATDATKDISEVMLETSLNISQKQGLQLYDYYDMLKTINGFMTIPYDKLFDITEDVTIRLRNAGHIMGSAMAEIVIKTDKNTIKIVATGDMGYNGIPLLQNPFLITNGDYIIVESTYGANNKTNVSYEEFGRDIQNTLESGGSVLIPAFTLEKTQKVIYVIGELKRKGIIKKDAPIIADSPTGIEITKIYRRYTKYYNKKALQTLSKYGNPLSFKSLHEVSGKIALMYHESNIPAIYLTSSGMLDYSNAPKHLLKMIDNPNNLLAIVGWQSPESLGRKLQDGAKKVTIPIKTYSDGNENITYIERPVKMAVKYYGRFSSHADGCDILKWLSNIQKTKRIFVVHGDKQNTLGLAEAIKTRLGFDAKAPALNEKIYLNYDDEIHEKKQHGNSILCNELGKIQKTDSVSDQ